MASVREVAIVVAAAGHWSEEELVAAAGPEGRQLIFRIGYRYVIVGPDEPDDWPDVLRELAIIDIATWDVAEVMTTPTGNVVTYLEWAPTWEKCLPRA